MLPLQQGCINTDQNANDPQDCQRKCECGIVSGFQNEFAAELRPGMMTPHHREKPLREALSGWQLQLAYKPYGRQEAQLTMPEAATPV